MTKTTRILFIGFVAIGIFDPPQVRTETEHVHSHGKEMEHAKMGEQEISGDKISIPDIVLVNQHGKRVRFYSDLVKGKAVAINSIFTTCTTICPPMGANFAHLQKLMDDRVGKDVALISISVDPVTDTPERLKAWSEKFNAGPGWTLLTGLKQDVDKLLKALKVFTADKTDHAPLILIGDGTGGNWTRVHGFTPPAKLSEILDGVLRASEKRSSLQGEHEIRSPAHKYFTDVTLVNQNGEEMRLYSDLLKGKVVIVNSFFASCGGSCPAMLSTFSKLQDQLGHRLGRDVHLISISVDPQTDTPGKLKALAEELKAKPGWHFLTGEKQNVDWALYKFGQYVEKKESHTNYFFIGNEPTGLWKKAFGLAQPEEIIQLVEDVLNDKG